MISVTKVDSIDWADNDTRSNTQIGMCEGAILDVAEVFRFVRYVYYLADIVQLVYLWN